MDVFTIYYVWLRKYIMVTTEGQKSKTNIYIVSFSFAIRNQLVTFSNIFYWFCLYNVRKCYKLIPYCKRKCLFVWLKLTLALKNILDQRVVVCAWKFKITCAIYVFKSWERNLKLLFCMSSIFFHALLSKTDLLLSNEVLRQKTNTAALSVKNKAKQLYITICAYL